MFRKFLIAVCVFAGFSVTASAADVTLKLHQLLPAQANLPKNFLAPWAEKVEKESNGRIKIELYPSMQLGGKPPALFGQVKDGFVDLIWTLPGYTPGRFPRTEVFELPFIAGSSEATSAAAWELFQSDIKEDFQDVHMIAVHVHGPGLIHSKEPINKLEDIKGKKVRGPTRLATNLLKAIGAFPVGMPVPAVPESLSKGVIDATAIPWEIVAPLRVHELVHNHTTFAKPLYTSFFIFAMNKDKYESLPADLKKVIDDNSGLEASKWAGRVMGEGDAPGFNAATKAGNNIIQLNAAETARWEEAASGVRDEWISEVKKKGIDGKALYDKAVAAIAKYSKM